MNELLFAVSDFYSFKLENIQTVVLKDLGELLVCLVQTGKSISFACIVF